MSARVRKSALEALSEAEKDALILNLWEDLREQTARADALAQRLASIEGAAPTAEGTSGRPLLTELQRAGKTRAATANPTVKRRLGSGLGFLRSRAAIGALVLVGLAFTLDHALGWYQHGRLEQKRLARLQLDRAANNGLEAELLNVAYEPDGKSYRLTIETRNVDGRQPIYVMLSPVRVFAQSGLTWQEVPAHAAAMKSAGVVKLTDRFVYETVFEPDLKDWAELMPGYMHIRFESNRLVSLRSEPDDDIAERRDRFYVYLKPHGADNEAIRKRMKYAGEPPIYIPMPPH